MKYHNREISTLFLNSKVKISKVNNYLVFVLIVLFTSSCGPMDQVDRAGQSVEIYYRSLIEDDLVQMINLSCASWEEGAQLEYDAFVGVAMELPRINCKTTSQIGQEFIVECEGQILATYGNEQQAFDLSGVEYSVIQEGGDYRMCGHR